MASTQARKPQIKINRTPGQNPCFDEILGDKYQTADDASSRWHLYDGVAQRRAG